MQYCGKYKYFRLEKKTGITFVFYVEMLTFALLHQNRALNFAFKKQNNKNPTEIYL